MPYQSNVSSDPQRGWSVNQTDMIIKTDAVGMTKRNVVVIDADARLMVKLIPTTLFCVNLQTTVDVSMLLRESGQVRTSGQSYLANASTC